MKVVQKHNPYDLRERWNIYLKAYQVYQATPNDKVKAVCSLVASSYMGVKWCNEKGHEFINFDEIDKQIINEEYTKLKNKGVLK